MLDRKTAGSRLKEGTVRPLSDHRFAELERTAVSQNSKRSPYPFSSDRAPVPFIALYLAFFRLPRIQGNLRIIALHTHMFTKEREISSNEILMARCP